MRWLYLVNLIFLGTVSIGVYYERQFAPPHQLPPPVIKQKKTWYQKIKPFCNPVEVTMALKRTPPTKDENDQAHAAACYALAGKIKKARQIFNSFSPSRQKWAANVVFNVAHPIADQGDDESAGPIMQFVVEFSPNHVMALYHAGISLFATGDYKDSGRHLTRFLELYEVDDGWTRNAEMALKKIRGG